MDPENEIETYQLGFAHILLMSFSTLHCILVTLLALAKVIMIVTVLPFPAALLILTGYMECVQLSGGSFVWKELHYNGKVDTHWNCISINRLLYLGENLESYTVWHSATQNYL